MDSAEYLHQEQERQFPSEKKVQIHADWQVRHSKLKGLSLTHCEWCEKPVEVKDTRARVNLCWGCEHAGRGRARQVIERYLDAHQKLHLSTKDRQRIAEAKTVRY